MAKQTKNYRELSEELDTIVNALQAPDVDVDQALELYERGQKVITELEQYLKTAENKISKLAATDEAV